MECSLPWRAWSSPEPVAFPTSCILPLGRIPARLTNRQVIYTVAYTCPHYGRIHTRFEPDGVYAHAQAIGWYCQTTSIVQRADGVFTVRKVIASFLPPSHLRIARCGSRLFVIEKEGRISNCVHLHLHGATSVPQKQLLPAQDVVDGSFEEKRENARTQERHDARLSQPNLQMTHHTESFSPGVPPKRILPPFGMSTGEGGVTRNSSAPSAPSLTRCGAEGEI